MAPTPTCDPCARFSSRLVSSAFTSTLHKKNSLTREPVLLRHWTAADGTRAEGRGRDSLSSGDAIDGRDIAETGTKVVAANLASRLSSGYKRAAARPLAPELGGNSRREGYTSRKLKKVNNSRKLHTSKMAPSNMQSVRDISFVGTARVLGSRGQWRDVLRLLDELAEDGIPLTSCTYNSAMSSIAKSGRWREALGLRDRMLAEGIKLDGYSFNALIAACSKGGNVTMGLELLREMVNAGVPRDCFSYNAALHGYVQHGDSKNALLMLQEMVADGVRPDLVSYSTVLACCGKRGEWELCLSLMDQMRSEGIAPNVYSFSALINACGKAGRWGLAMKTLEDMQASGLTPNEHNWLTAIAACGSAGRWEEALQLIDKLEGLALAKGAVPMSTILYNHAIDTCARAGRWNQGVLLLERMKSNPTTPPDARTYSSLINACAKDANLEDALAYLAEMRAVGLAPTTFAYISAMNATKMAGRRKEALDLLDQMSEDGLLPDVFSFNNMVDAYGKNGQLARALLQPDANAAEGEGMSNTDLNDWWEEEPDELVTRLENNGIRPDAMSFSVLIDACARGGNPQAAAKLLNKMKSRGLRPNSFSYNSVIDSCRSGTGDEYRLALELLDDMRRSSGLTPDVFSFNTAIASCAKAGDWRRSLDLLAGMKVEGVTPDILSYNGVIAACAKGGQWRIGLELLGKVRADPTLEPNQRTYSAVINCFQKVQGGRSAVSLASTLAGFSSDEEMLTFPKSDVHLGGSGGPPDGSD